MAVAIVAFRGYRLDEATRLALLPPEPPREWLDADLTALEAADFSHRDICAGTPRCAALSILRRDAGQALADAGGDYFGERCTA